MIRRQEGETKTMKAIMIDALKKEIREVENSKDVMIAQKYLNCDSLEAVYLVSDKDSPPAYIYIDEFGQEKDASVVGGFKIANFPHPIIGSGLIVGVEVFTGEEVDTHLSVDDVKSMVIFL